MKFEVLKKSHLKRNLLIGVTTIAVLTAGIFTFTKAKYRTRESIPLVNGTINYELSDLNLVGIYIQGDDGYTKKDKEEEIQYRLPFGGGSGAGVNISPVAFLVVQDTCVKLLPIEHSSTIDKLIDYVPDLMEKINCIIHKKIDKKEEKQKQDIGEFMDNFENNIDDDFEEQIENVESETKNDSNN